MDSGSTTPCIKEIKILTETKLGMPFIHRQRRQITDDDDDDCKTYLPNASQTEKEISSFCIFYIQC